MKTIMIICGAGHATSTVVRTKVESWLKSEGLASEVEVKQSSIGAQAKDIAADKYDILISTTQVPENIKDKVIMGLGLLTGFGAEQVFAQVKERLGK